MHGGERMWTSGLTYFPFHLKLQHNKFYKRWLMNQASDVDARLVLFIYIFSHTWSFYTYWLLNNLDSSSSSIKQLNLIGPFRLLNLVRKSLLYIYGFSPQPGGPGTSVSGCLSPRGAAFSAFIIVSPFCPGKSTSLHFRSSVIWFFRAVEPSRHHLAPTLERDLDSLFVNPLPSPFFGYI